MSQIVAQDVTSLPVPEVLGIAINGQDSLDRSCSLYRYFLEECLCDCNIETLLARSIVLPPPIPIIKLQLLLLNNLVTKSTVSGVGLGVVLLYK